MPTRLLAALSTAVLLLVLPGCGADEPGGGDGLVVYSGRNENLVQPLFDRFTEQTGIEVTPRYGDSASLAAALLEEGDSTRASVFLSQDAGALGALQDVDRLAPLDQALLDRVPAAYRSREGDWVGVSGRSRVLVYNEDLVDPAELPDSVLDLVEPRFRGKVGYAPPNASWQAFVTGLRVVQGEQAARTFLEGFKANEPRAFDGNVAVLDAVEAGDVPFGLVNHYYLYEKTAATEGGLEALHAVNHLFAPGDPGALVNVAGVGVLQGRADDRTRQLVDFLLGTEAQTYFAEETKEFPLVAGVAPDVPGLPPLAELQGPDVDLSELDSLQQTLALLEEVGLT